MELRMLPSILMAWTLTFFSFLVLVLCAKDVKGTSQCICLPRHPQQQYCQANFVLRGRIIGTIGPGGEEEEEESGMAPMDPEDGVTAYKVKVERIYKGEGEGGLHRHLIVVMMRRDKECDLKKLRKGRVYVLSGSIDETGRYELGPCDWVIQYSQLTKMQKQGVRYLYKKYCGTCEISPCFTGRCKQGRVSTNVCQWDLTTMRFNDGDCEGKHSRCIRFGNGNCGWYRSFDLKGCYRDRKPSRKNRVG